MNAPSQAYARVLFYGADSNEVDDMRRGSEAAFRTLVGRHHDTLLRVARTWVRDASLAEEVVQQTWIEVLEGHGVFEGLSSVRTWLCGICINLARARLRSEGRTVPMSSLAPEGDSEEMAVDPSRFLGPDSHWAGHWLSAPRPWSQSPEEAAQDRELGARLSDAIDRLPPAQRMVVTLRDVEGLSGAEVSELMGLSEGHQRVLLHRGRSRLRGMLDELYESRGAHDSAPGKRA
jgi:RNA polymerase sigma-70 factor (ECF subfamily)